MYISKCVPTRSTPRWSCLFFFSFVSISPLRLTRPSGLLPETWVSSRRPSSNKSNKNKRRRLCDGKRDCHFIRFRFLVLLPALNHQCCGRFLDGWVDECAIVWCQVFFFFFFFFFFFCVESSADRQTALIDQSNCGLPPSLHFFLFFFFSSSSFWNS